MKGKGRILSHYSVSFFLSTFAQCLSCTELFKMTLIKKMLSCLQQLHYFCVHSPLKIEQNTVRNPFFFFFSPISDLGAENIACYSCNCCLGFQDFNWPLSSIIHRQLY